MADLELRVHRRLLERFDLHELEANRIGDAESLVRLERQIEDVCRELQLFSEANEPLLEELVGINLRDYIVQQLILESDPGASTTLSFLRNEFDVPASQVPEREGELSTSSSSRAGSSGWMSCRTLARGSRVSRSSSMTCSEFCGHICIRSCGSI